MLNIKLQQPFTTFLITDNYSWGKVVIMATIHGEVKLLVKFNSKTRVLKR